MSTAEVAECIGSCEGVEDVNVYGVQVPRHDGRAGCAAVVLGSLPFDGALEKRLERLATKAQKELPRYAIPIFVRVAKQLAKTGTNKVQKHELVKQGVDPGKVMEESGDELFWLKDGRYVKFGREEYGRVSQGEVKL